MVCKTVTRVACSQSGHFYRMDICHNFLRQHSEIWLHFPANDSQLVLLTSSCMHMDLFHFRCSWWQAGQTNKLKLTIGTAFWSWMWLIFINFLCPCSISSWKTWWKLSFCAIYHFAISDVFCKLGIIQHWSSQNKRGTVWSDISLINRNDDSHYYRYFWARVLANQDWRCFTCSCYWIIKSWVFLMDIRFKTWRIYCFLLWRTHLLLMSHSFHIHYHIKSG